MTSMKKVESEAHNSIMKVLFLKISIVLYNAKVRLEEHSHPVTQNVKKMCTQGWGLMKLTILIASARTFFFFNLLIYFSLCWIFVALHRLSLDAASGGYSALHFSLRCLLSLQSSGPRLLASVVAARGSSFWVLEGAGFSSRGTLAWLLLGMRNISRPGIRCHLHWQVDSYPPCHQGIQGHV